MDVDWRQSLRSLAGKRLKMVGSNIVLPKLDGPDDAPTGFRHLLCCDGSYPFAATNPDQDPGSTGKAVMGQVIYMAVDIVPEGWLVADGRSLSIDKFNELHSVIGNRFGGDKTHFNLPNLINATSTPRGTQPLICISGNYPSTCESISHEYFLCQVIYLAFDEPIQDMIACTGSYYTTHTPRGLAVQNLIGDRYGSLSKEGVQLPKLGDAKGMIDGLTPRLMLGGDYPPRADN